MPVWKCTGKTVTQAQAVQALAKIKSACFGCDSHSSGCPIAKAAGEVESLVKEDTRSVKEQIHEQITGALLGAKFPIKTPRALIAAFPNGADTTCCVGDLKMTAGDAGKLLTAGDFPFTTAKAVADTIVERAGL